MKEVLSVERLPILSLFRGSGSDYSLRRALSDHRFPQLSFALRAG